MISHDKDNVPTFVNDISSEQLNNIVSRIERLEHDKACVGEDIKAVYSEAKSEGFDPKIIREIIKIRKKDAHEIEHEELLLSTYKIALGMTVE